MIMAYIPQDGEDVFYVGDPVEDTTVYRPPARPAPDTSWARMEYLRETDPGARLEPRGGARVALAVARRDALAQLRTLEAELSGDALRSPAVGRPQPGDIGFAPITGRGGKVARYGQVLLGDDCRFHHAYFVLPGSVRPELGAQLLAYEAMPAGSRIVPMDDRYGTGYAYARLPWTPGQRDAAIAYAVTKEGTPYSFADYLALTAQRLHIPAPRLDAYVASSGHEICSQAVDNIVCQGVTDPRDARFEQVFHLFRDGRRASEVTPGDLFYRSMELGGLFVWWGPDGAR